MILRYDQKEVNRCNFELNIYLSIFLGALLNNHIYLPYEF
jgi:hypothetical protein